MVQKTSVNKKSEEEIISGNCMVVVVVNSYNKNIINYHTVIVVCIHSIILTKVTIFFNYSIVEYFVS